MRAAKSMVRVITMITTPLCRTERIALILTEAFEFGFVCGVVVYGKKFQNGDDTFPTTLAP